MSKLIPKDALTMIAEFIGTIKEFMYLAMTCRSYFEDLILCNDYSLNEIFKRYSIKSTNIPDHIKLNLNFLKIRNTLYGPIIRLNFEHFKNLQELSLHFHFHFTGDYFENFEKEVIIDGLSRLSNLKKLCIDGGAAHLEKSLQNVTNLTDLCLRYVTLEEKYLQQLPHLESLTLLNCNEINSADFVTKCKKLKTLHTNLNLANLSSLPVTITNLKISKTGINESKIMKLFNLTCLELYDEGISGECLKNLSQLEKLKIMYYYYNQSVSSFQGENLLYLNNLKELTLCHYYNDFEIPLNLKTLEKLKLSNVNVISDKDLNILTNLKQLKITQCENFTGICLQNLRKLKKLETDIPLIDEYLKECRDLEYLKFTNYHELEGSFLLNMKKIKYLFVGKDVKEDKESFFNFKAKITQLFHPLIGTNNKYKYYF